MKDNNTNNEVQIKPEAYRMAVKLCPANMKLNGYINDTLWEGLQLEDGTPAKEANKSAEINTSTGVPITPDVYGRAVELCPARIRLNDYINAALWAGLKEDQDYEEGEAKRLREEGAERSLPGEPLKVYQRNLEVIKEMCPAEYQQDMEVWFNDLLAAMLEFKQHTDKMNAAAA